MQIASISEELAKKTEDAARQQEEITHLLSQIVDLQKKAKAVRPRSSGCHREGRSELTQGHLTPGDRDIWLHVAGVCAALLEKELSGFNSIIFIAAFLLRIGCRLVEFV